MDEFVQVLRREVADSGMTLKDIADRLRDEGISLTKHTVSLWTRGKQPMKPDEVFAIERVLGLPAGKLSGLLGYVPAESRGARTVIEAIEHDRALSGPQRQTLRSAYEAFRRR